MQFEGKTAVVTGAASGLGRGLCQVLGEAGARVVAADIEDEGLDDTVALLARAGVPAIAQPTDVTDVASVEALAERAYDEFGAVHVLCNNAGVFAGGLAWESTDDDWDWVLAVNLRGVVNGCRAFVPRMLAGGEVGHVLNTASLAGLVAAPFSAVYCTSKFAVVGYTECLAHDLALQSEGRIGVSVVCPGGVATGIARSERNRPEHHRGTDTDGSRLVREALADMTIRGADPLTAARRILDEVEAGHFFVSTTDAYDDHLAVVAEDLRTRRSPTFQLFE